MKVQKRLLSLLMIFLLINYSTYVSKVNVEGMEPGNYPISVSSPFDTYKVKNPGYQRTEENNNLDYPLFLLVHVDY